LCGILARESPAGPLLPIFTTARVATTFVSNAQERVPTASLRRLRSVGFRILYATHTGCAPPPDERKPLATGVHRHSPRAPLGWRRTRVHPLLGPTPRPRTAAPPSRSDRGGAHRSTGGQSPRPKRSAPFPPWAFPAGSAARGCFLMRSPRDADAQSSVRLPTAGGACAGRPARGGGPPSPLPPHRHCDRSPRGGHAVQHPTPAVCRCGHQPRRPAMVQPPLSTARWRCPWSSSAAASHARPAAAAARDGRPCPPTSPPAGRTAKRARASPTRAASDTCLHRGCGQGAPTRLPPTPRW